MGGLWVSAFIGLAALRVVQLERLFLGGGLSKAVALLEGIALLFGMINVMVARRRDESWRGLGVPAGYALGLALLPTFGPDPGASSWFFLGVGLVASYWALWSLRGRFSIAGATWVGLCDWGPYRYVRHPQLLARLCIIMAVAFSMGVGDVWGVARCCVAIWVTLGVIWCEEGLLETVPEYEAYSQRVPWRVLPGVF